jgi:hypothetical protein
MITLQFLICSILIIILIIWLINKKKYLENFGDNCNFTLDKEVDDFKARPILSNCIKQCSNINQSLDDDEDKCDITQCQERCLDCGPDAGWLDKNGNEIICPWTNEIKIKAPDAPKIRGFAEDVGGDDIGAIVSIEWKKPETNGSKILNYVVELKETLSNRDSVKLLYIESECDICSFPISNLKEQTSYDISLRATGNISNNAINEDIELSPSSNMLTITTKGEKGSSLRSLYSELNGNFNDVNYNRFDSSCDKYGTNHILDNIKPSEINIKYYLEKQRDKKLRDKGHFDPYFKSKS